MNNDKIPIGLNFIPPKPLFYFNLLQILADVESSTAWELSMKLLQSPNVERCA